MHIWVKKSTSKDAELDLHSKTKVSPAGRWNNHCEEALSVLKLGENQHGSRVCAAPEELLINSSEA